MSELIIPGRPTPRPEVIQVPVIDHHNTTKIIGSIAIGKPFMPQSPNFHFELGWRVDTKHADGTPNLVSLVYVSLVMDQPYIKADGSGEQPIS